MKIKYVSFLCMYIGCVYAQLDEVVQEDKNPSKAQFSAGIPQAFKLGPNTFSSPATVFCAAGSEGAGDYTIAQFNGVSFIPFIRSAVTINHETVEKNPFYDKEITRLQSVFNLPLFITKDDSKTLYYVTAAPNQEQKTGALSITNINDGFGKPCNGIVDFTFIETSTGGEKLWYTCAAVKAHDGTFADKGSGLALCKFKIRSVYDWQNNVPVDEHAQKEEKKEESEAEKNVQGEDSKQKFFINPLDAQRGILGANCAVPFDIEPTEEQLIQINGGLDYLQENAVDLFWEENFGRLYVALQIKTKDNAGPDQGACALLVGHIWKDRLVLKPIVSPAVFSPDANNIIGAVGPNRYVSLHKVRTLFSTTGMQYLVVVGGNGKPEETNNKVHAFPMSNIGNKQGVSLEELLVAEKHGGIAKRSANPDARFFPGNYGRFIGRYFDEVASDPCEFYTAEQAAVRVGGDSVLPGAIKNIYTARDCIIAHVPVDGNGQEAGVFYSQAIFDKNGCIAAWSSWKRVPGSRPEVLGLTIDPHQFAFTFFETAQNSLALRINGWSYVNKKEDSVTLSGLVSQVLPREEYGVQGLFDFDMNYEGLSGEIKTSLLAVTGNKKILLVQTGVDDEQGIFRANHSFSNIAYRKTGAINELLPETTQALVLEGGVLNDLGPITAAEIITMNDQSWLVVGGVNGTALLCDDEGNGWSTQAGLGKGFSSFKEKLAFKKLTNHTFVQKLRFHNGCLYILTDSSLDYLKLSDNFIAHNFVQTLVTKQILKGSFSDALITDACILLATRKGVFLGAEDSIHAPGVLTWQKIDLPGMSLPALKFFTVTTSNRESQVFSNGQIYVLSGSAATSQAEVHRLFLHDGQLMHLNDFGHRGHISRFINFGGFRTNFVTDGLIHLSTRSTNGAIIHVLPAFIAGKSVASSKGFGAPVSIEKVSNMRYITKNSATGSWLVGGDFGICSYE